MTLSLNPEQLFFWQTDTGFNINLGLPPFPPQQRHRSFNRALTKMCRTHTEAMFWQYRHTCFTQSNAQACECSRDLLRMTMNNKKTCPRYKAAGYLEPNNTILMEGRQGRLASSSGKLPCRQWQTLWSAHRTTGRFWLRLRRRYHNNAVEWTAALRLPT